MSKITFDPIIRGLCPDSVSVLLKINPVNLHSKNKNIGETYFCIGILGNKAKPGLKKRIRGLWRVKFDLKVRTLSGFGLGG